MRRARMLLMLSTTSCLVHLCHRMRNRHRTFLLLDIGWGGGPPSCPHSCNQSEVSIVLCQPIRDEYYIPGYDEWVSYWVLTRFSSSGSNCPFKSLSSKIKIFLKEKVMRKYFFGVLNNLWGSSQQPRMFPNYVSSSERKWWWNSFCKILWLLVRRVETILTRSVISLKNKTSHSLLESTLRKI